MTQPVLWGGTFTAGYIGGIWTPKFDSTVLRDGWIVVTWRDNSDNLVRYRLLNVDGSFSGSAEIVSDQGEDSRDPSIAALPNGRFIVAYDVSAPIEGQTLYAKTYDVFQGKIGGETVHIEDIDSFHNGSVVAFADGGYTFSYDDTKWNFYHTESLSRVWEKRVSANGSVTTTEVLDQDDTGPVGKSVVLATQDSRYVSLYAQRSMTEDNIYFDIRSQNGNRIALKSLSHLPSDAASLCDIAALENGDFIFVWVENTASTGSLKAARYTSDGLLFQSTTLYASNQPLAKPSVVKVPGGYVFAAPQKAAGPIHMGTFTSNGIELFDYAVTDPVGSTLLRSLNDGRFILQWVPESGVREIKGQIFDPRQSAIDWTGGDVGQQYAGTKFGDQLHGGAGNDTLFGGAGDDVLDGGGGANRLDGGGGRDKVSYLSLTGNTGVVVNLETNDNDRDALGDLLFDIEVVEGSNAADIMAAKKALSNVNRVELFGQGGNDTLYSEGNGDTLWGGQGDDLVEGRGGNDSIDGGADQDRLYGDAGNDTLNGGTGQDRLRRRG